MREKKPADDSPNPDFRRPTGDNGGDSYRRRRLRSLDFHKHDGTLELHYQDYPEDRPRQPDPSRTVGRGR